jgi:hypothetical protein
LSFLLSAGVQRAGVGRLTATAVLAVVALGAPGAVSRASAQPQKNGPLPGPLPLHPANHWWNTDVSQAPLDSNSQAFINFIGATRRLHPDMGGSAHEDDDPDAIYGIPYIVVPGNTPLVQVTFEEDDESDFGAPGRPLGYPIPDITKTQAGWYEGGAPAGSTSSLDSANGDRHMLIVDRDNRVLFELANLRWDAGQNRWEAYCGAIFPLDSVARRPDTWTSSDAAGLAILPGLLRYDEVFGSEPIKHAFRFTVQSTNGYVFPASHRAGSTSGALPMGARLRLKANVNISTYPAHIQRVFQAMKTYGLVVADNGSNMYITGTSDPRWEAEMDALLTAFNKLNAGMFEVVQRGWQPTGPPPPPPDSDTDGLPNAWEQQFGLDGNSATGANGADGDPDDDGMTNAQELANHTHPRGFHQRYFAEGVSNAFFTTQFAAMNPGTTDAHVQFRFQRHDGVVVEHVLVVPAHGRVTLNPAASVSGMASADYSTVLDSDEVVVFDRTVSWDATGYGSHAETSVAEPSRTWFLAEGSTSWDFKLFYLLQNPNDEATVATIRYLRAFGAPITKAYGLPPHSRTTIPVNDEDAGLVGTDVSAEITAGAPIIVERSMYLSRPGQPFAAGHGSAGVTHAANEWFLAEGATGTLFDLFVLIANPDSRGAVVKATYLLPNGSTLEKNYEVAGNSRFTIWVDDEVFPGLGKALASTPVSVKLTSINDVPVVVERTMWWPDGGWFESHNSPGATETGLKWGLAEGEVGGSRQAQTYILIANTSATAGQVRVTLLFEGGGETQRVYNVPANSRSSVAVGSDFATANNKRFGAIVESLGAVPAQIVVERAMYTNVAGVVWAAGTNAGATKLVQ